MKRVLILKKREGELMCFNGVIIWVLVWMEVFLMCFIYINLLIGILNWFVKNI